MIYDAHLGRFYAVAIKVFLSYSHEDEEHRQHFERHLSALVLSGQILIWTDRRPVGGDPIHDLIADHLGQADLIFLLISAHFLGSEYCINREMTPALQRHRNGGARVVPIMVSPCDFKDMPFERLLILPTDARPVTEWPNQDKAWENVARETRRIVEAMAASTPADLTADASVEDTLLVRVFRLSQRAEKFLRTRFKANGNGLGELIRNCGGDLRSLDAQFEGELRRFVPIRNKLVHNESHDVSADEVEAVVRTVEEMLGRQLAAMRDAATVATENRQWFVCRSGMGDFRSISDALARAGDNDTIYIMAGVYEESLILTRPVTLMGRTDGKEPVTIAPAGGDGVQIAADGVSINDLTIRAVDHRAFAAVVLPGADQPSFQRCRFSAPEGTAFVCMSAAAPTLKDCVFQASQVGLRIDERATATDCAFLENQHGLVTRHSAVASIMKCSFEQNEVGIQLRDKSKAIVSQSSFNPGRYAIVGGEQSECNLEDARFGNYESDEMLVKMSEDCRIFIRNPDTSSPNPSGIQP
jgi:hypothetical protein